MKARIATVAALVSLSLAGLVAPAAADECALADQVVAGCRTAPSPDPEPGPQPAPQPAPQPQPEPTQQQSVQPGHQPGAVSRILVLMNNERRAHGLPQFSVRSDVSATSSNHSEAMAAGGTIWHNDAYFTAANKKRLGAALLGENVARNPEIDDAHRRLMDSPPHRANLLDRRFTVVGLAVYRSSTGSLYVTQNFVQPKSGAEAPRAATPAKAAAKPAPAPAPTAPAAAAPAAPAPAPVVEAAPVVHTPEVLAAGPGAALFAAPAALGGTRGSQPPTAALVALAVFALVAAGALVLRGRRSVFAPLLSRIGR